MARKHSDRFGPIERVFISSNVGGNPAIEELNRQAVWELHKNFGQITNSHETGFGLTDLEDKIVKAGDAYVFLPIVKEIREPTAVANRDLFRKLFKVTSLFVGVQTKDPNLKMDPNHSESPLKPIIMVNHEGCYDFFLDLVRHMQKLGTISQRLEDILHPVATIGEAIDLLKVAHLRKQTAAVPHHAHGSEISADKISPGLDPQEEHKPDFSVCVFCSASTKNPQLLKIAHQLGSRIASHDWGVISGLGSSGMMGAVVKGAAESRLKTGKGWIGGSNLPRIIAMEGLPEEYDKIWLKDDIYKRMEIMVEKSQGFVIMPGGMGTVQELMALLLLKHVEGKSGLMNDKKFGNKPIILVNQGLKTQDGQVEKFWKPLVEMAETYGFARDIIVVDTVEQAVKALKTHHERGHLRSVA